MSTAPRRPRFPAQVLPQPAAPARAGMRGPVSSAAASVMVPAGLAQASAPTATTVGALPTLAGGRLVDVTGQQGARERMVQRLRGLQGLHPAVIAAMRDVPRHLFVDSALVGKAYEENSLPIGFGQTISKPAVVARMLSLIMEAVAPSHAARVPGRVLEIGTGCGYQAMVMSRLAEEVYSIERLRGLHERARANLRPMRVANLHLLFGDGMAGYARGAPYAAIVSAAGGDAIPQAWVEQLAVGGRIVAPTATAQGHQVLVVVDKTPTGVRQQTLEGVHFVPLKSGVD